MGTAHGLQITYLKDNSTRNVFVYHEDGKVSWHAPFGVSDGKSWARERYCVPLEEKVGNYNSTCNKFTLVRASQGSVYMVWYTV